MFFNLDVLRNCALLSRWVWNPTTTSARFINNPFLGLYLAETRDNQMTLEKQTLKTFSHHILCQVHACHACLSHKLIR